MDSPESGIIIQEITIRPTQRQAQDITKWRQALQQAEAINPIRYPLMDLYDEIRLDGVLDNILKKRILNVTRRRLILVNKAGEEIPGMDNMLKGSSFRRLRSELISHIFYGSRVVELMREGNELKIFPIPVKHVLPKQGVITKEQSDSTGIPYREKPASNYLVEVGDWDNLGVLLKCAPYVIYKRGAFGDWAQFAEIFGMPFREARYDGYNTQVRAQLEQAMEAAGSASYMILPKEAEITLHEAKNSANSADLYDKLRVACNEELIITVLGQSSTTMQQAGKLGGNDDAHEQTEDDIQADDLEDELTYFNEKVLPVLLNLGFPLTGATFQHETIDEQLSLKDRVDIAIKMREKDVPVSDDYFYETTGIPKPADYGAQKAAKEAERQAKQKAIEQAPDPGKLPPKGGRALTQKLLDFFA